MKLSPTQIFKGKKIFFIGGTGFAGKFLLSGLVMFFLLAGQVLACEPAVPLGQMALFPGAIAKSFYLLAATVLLKAFAFALLEKSLVWWRAVLFIFLANVFSTIVGFVSVIPLTMPALLPVFILTFLLSIIPARGLAQRYFSGRQSQATYIIAGVLTVISFASMLFFTFARQAIETGSFGTYWIAKIICVYLGLIFGIIITIFYEEWLTAKLAKRKDTPTPFLTSVTRANLIALLFMMIVTAVVVIPEKIQNQDYGFLR